MGKPSRTEKKKYKSIPKMCMLEENKVCDNCCECFICSLDPSKTCDNCGKCLELPEHEFILNNDYFPDKDALKDK